MLTDQALLQATTLNQWARRHKVKFIAADSRGLFSYLFVDLGERFEVVDDNGEPVKEVLVEFASEDGVVTTVEDEEHELADGDLVIVSSSSGRPLEEKPVPVEIKVIGVSIPSLYVIVIFLRPLV